MSDIVLIQNDCAAQLLGKTTLNGVRILTVDDHDVLNELQRAIARFGTAAVIGLSRGYNEAPNSPGLQQRLDLTVVVMENVVLNRGRKIAGTVANEAERLALAGTIDIGQIVEQTNISTGKFKLAHEGYTTALVDIFTDPNANFIESALNVLISISQVGGVTVSGTVATGFTITWNNPGARTLIEVLKLGAFPFGGIAYIVEQQVGTTILPTIQKLYLRQWFWLIGGTGESPSNWGYFFTGKEILQLVMRVLHSFAPSPTQKVVSTGFYYGSREDVVDIAATFQIRLYLDQTTVT